MAGNSANIKLATAYVQLIPSLSGAEGRIQSELSGMNFASAGRSVGNSIAEGITQSSGTISSAFAAARNAVSKLTSGVRTYVTGITSATGATGKLQAAMSPVTNAVANVRTAFSTAKAGVQSWTSSISSATGIAGKAKAAFAPLSSAASAVGSGFKSALSGASTLASSGFSALKSAASACAPAISAVTTAAKGFGVAASAAVSGLAALTTMSVKEYADYEQNIGGINKLFGDSANTMIEYARNAYSTAGVDANTYMEQVTSFSASLITSLGGDTAAAAEYANRAMVDMSDNANTFGTDIESIQVAYQGFAKQNYTIDLGFCPDSLAA